MPTTPDLRIRLGALSLKNPVLVASGTFGYGQEYAQYFDIARLGAVVTKSLSLKPRAGNKPPRLVETPAGMLNAIGLQNVGVEAYIAEKLPFLRESGAEIIANIYGGGPEEYAELAQRLEQADAASAIEANLSCPNVHDARRTRGASMVAQAPEAIQEYTRVIRQATSLPLYVKLTPNVMDIREPALAAEEGGADAVALINTLLGMAIDAEKRKPRLTNIVGGLSGPAIRPVAVKMVWDVSQVVGIPIVGIGGICTASDAVEFLLAGATAVTVGSMTFRQPDAPMRVLGGLEDYMNRHGIESVGDLVGAMEV
ncbi:MAG: dihydroorotate dehydrogenase [Candidatus Hydrogenedentota bacterium]